MNFLNEGEQQCMRLLRSAFNRPHNDGLGAKLYQNQYHYGGGRFIQLNNHK